MESPIRSICFDPLVRCTDCLGFGTGREDGTGPVDVAGYVDDFGCRLDFGVGGILSFE